MIKNLKKSSAWNASEIVRFLAEQIIPVRLACLGNYGYPLVASHWYQFEQGVFFLAMHEGSLTCELLQRDPRCAFEVSPDSMPYRGVRGQANARLSKDGAADTLQMLLDRYSIDCDSGLATWLLSRSEEEYVVTLEPTWVSSWDFSERMK